MFIRKKTQYFFENKFNYNYELLQALKESSICSVAFKNNFA